MYKVIGFNIEFSNGNNEFNLNDLRDNIRSASLKSCAKGRHVPIIERSIKSIKKGLRYTTHSVPYKRYTNLMTRLLVECIIHSVK